MTTPPNFGYSARVHQAQGIVVVQADCGMDEALRRMEARGLELHQNLEDVAMGVVGHRIWFRHEDPPEA